MCLYDTGCQFSVAFSLFFFLAFSFVLCYNRVIGGGFWWFFWVGFGFVFSALLGGSGVLMFALLRFACLGVSRVSVPVFGLRLFCFRSGVSSGFSVPVLRVGVCWLRVGPGWFGFRLPCAVRRAGLCWRRRSL